MLLNSSEITSRLLKPFIKSLTLCNRFVKLIALRAIMRIIQIWRTVEILVIGGNYRLAVRTVKKK